MFRRRAWAPTLTLSFAALCACSTPEPNPAVTVGAPGVYVEKLALYQALERVLVNDRTPVDATLPIVSGKDALLRVFYRTDASYDGAPVRARLTWGNGNPLEQVTALHPQSEGDRADSALDFVIPGVRVVAGASYAVELLEDVDASFANADARYPTSGLQALPALAPPHTLRVVLVPLLYQADGSNRAPDTSAAELATMEDVLRALYPVANVELTVHAAIPTSWDLSVVNNWSALVDDLVTLRAAEAPADDVYYYGMVAPADSLVATQTPIDGLAATIVTDPADAAMRVAVGLGYAGEPSAYLAAHELGHVHGRRHAPCGGAAGTDPAFPHPTATLGTLGYDPMRGVLLPASDFRDVMGYCDPRWVSDYTYEALATRVDAVSTAAAWHAPATPDAAAGSDARAYAGPVRYARVAIQPSGTTRFLPATQHAALYGGEPLAVRVTTTAGATHDGEAQLFRYDHVPGGVVYLPLGAGEIARLETEIDGVPLSIERTPAP